MNLFTMGELDMPAGGLFTQAEMSSISAEMDAAAPDYHEGHGHSWWVKVQDGASRLARMQGFDLKSRGAAALIQDERFLRIGRITRDGHVQATMPDNRIEALIKPLQAWRASRTSPGTRTAPWVGIATIVATSPWGSQSPSLRNDRRAWSTNTPLKSIHYAYPLPPLR